MLELRRQAALLEAEKAKALEEKAKAEAELAAAEAEKAAAIALKEEAEALAKAAREEARSEAPAGREDVESMLRDKLGQSDGEAGAPTDAYASVLDRLGGGLGGRIFSAGPEKPIDKPFLPEPEPIMPSDGPGAGPFDLFAQPAVALVSAPAADSAAESEGAAEGGLSKRQKAQLDLQNWLASKGKKKERAEKREETEEERQKREREEAYMLAEARQSVGRPELDPDFYDPVKKSQVLTKDFSEKRARSMAEFDQSAASSADDKTAAAAAPTEEGVKTIVLEGDIAVPIYDSSVAPSPFLEIPTPNLEGSGMDLTRHSSELADALSFEESLRATRPETAAEGSEESSGAGEAEPQAAEAEKIGVEGGDEKKTGDLEAPSPLPTGRNLPKLQDLEVEGGLLARLDKMKERIDQDKQRKAGKHEAEAHDALEREAREREAQERAALEREAQERAAREREAQEREAREREAQERAAREREAQERAALEREAQERAALEREAQEREALEREAQEREAEAKAAAVEALGASERFGAGSAEGLEQASADRREIEGYVLKPEKSAARILKVMPTAHRRAEFGPIRGAMDQDLPRLFSNARVLVVGDVMLDRYWFGEADSIAPEAPVPVTRIEKIERRPGGAANVARNIAELGGHAQLIAAVGDDEAGRELAELLRRASIDAKLTVDASIATTIKLRVVSRNQQMIRLDFDNAPAAETLGALMDDFRAALPRCDVVVLSDYGKGALRRVNEMVEAARAAGKPALIDPKGVDFLKYRGATAVMPNRRELKEIVGEWEDELDLADKANQLRRSLQCDKLLMTRGSEGLSLFKESRAINQPTIAREVYDASGAGDTVSAMMALGMAAGLDDVECMKIANAAAGVVIGKLGSSVCALRELMERKPLNSLA